MPYAVTLRLDANSAAQVRVLWDVLTAAGFANNAAELGYEPHLTLALLDDANDASRLTDIVGSVTADWPAMPLHLAAVAAFPADPATLWLAPTVTAPLLERHAALSAALPVVHPYYRAGTWIPHVTLADDVVAGATGEGISLITEQYRPFTATLDRVELLRFRPISLLWHARLADSDTRT